MTTQPHGAPHRAARADGTQTRAHLLETAGALIAERGYAATSSKDICVAAGVNLAAVNYHFGSRDGLYEAVLVEAHRQILNQDMLASLATADASARDRLCALLAHLVQHAAEHRKSWGFGVIVREIVMPSPLAPTLVDKAIKPKVSILTPLVAEVLGLSPTHPAVQRGLVLAVFPCMGLLLAPRQLRGRAFPAFDPRKPDLVDDMCRYALAGLDALARAHRGDAIRSGKSAPHRRTGSAAGRARKSARRTR